MKHGYRAATLALVAAFCLAAVALSAQNLLDNDFYKQAQDLLSKSQAAMDAGDYDGAAQLAKQAQDALDKSNAYVADKLQFYRANGWLSQANDRVAYAKSIQADVNYKEDYTIAVAQVTSAKTALDAQKYDDSITASKAAIDALKDIAPKTAAAPKPAPAPQALELPEYYVVRLIIPLRDCFWRIAAYPWVYNDPWKWKLLYNANKNLIPDPNNPDLIEPGERFVIPPLAGETRSGDYDPAKEKDYPTAPAAQ